MTAVPTTRPSRVASLEDAERLAVSDFLDAHPGGTGAPVAVVVAAYDEEATVAEVVRSVPASAAGLATEVIVVVDGATDSTAPEAAGAGALVCEVPVNRGQGAALRLGYHLARLRGADVIATLDADGQYDPAELDAVVGPIVAGQADFVTGSRRLGTELTTDGARHAGVVVFAALISVMIGRRITDPACGLRAMRADVSAEVTLDQPQYQAGELLISAALAGYRVTEVAITMRPREAGVTKKGGNFLYGVRFGGAILKTWWRDRVRARPHDRRVLAFGRGRSRLRIIRDHKHAKVLGGSATRPVPDAGVR